MGVSWIGKIREGGEPASEADRNVEGSDCTEFL